MASVCLVYCIWLETSWLTTERDAAIGYRYVNLGKEVVSTRCFLAQEAVLLYPALEKQKNILLYVW